MLSMGLRLYGSQPHGTDGDTAATRRQAIREGRHPQIRPSAAWLGHHAAGFLNDYGVAYSTNAVTWGRKPAGGFSSTDAAWSSGLKK